MYTGFKLQVLWGALALGLSMVYTVLAVRNCRIRFCKWVVLQNRVSFSLLHDISHLHSIFPYS